VVNEKLGGLTSGMFAIFSNKYTPQILTLIWRISAPLVKKDHYRGLAKVIKNLKAQQRS
jgi:hypothetical protein